MSDPDTILFWNGQWCAPLPVPAEAPPGAFTTERGAFSTAAAVVFHLPSLAPEDVPDPAHAKPPGQLWVAWSQECDLNVAHQRDPAFMRRFDWRMTYHQDADVFAPYVGPSMERSLRGAVALKEPGCLVAAFISSDIDQSGRVGYLRELMRHVEVHSYGKLFPTHRAPSDPRPGALALLCDRVAGKLARMLRRPWLRLPGFPPPGQDSAARFGAKLATIARYRFTLAFENACARDYLTEKLYEPLMAGSVPVYLGAPNVAEFAPGARCLVNVADWPSPAALARHLQEADRDDTLYRSYHAWRDEPFAPGFARLLDRVREPLLVRLREAVLRARRSRQ